MKERGAHRFALTFSFFCVKTKGQRKRNGTSKT